MKMHYRLVKCEENFLTGGDSVTSIKIPCGNQEARVTTDTTKNESEVTCLRCLRFLETKEGDAR